MCVWLYPATVLGWSIYSHFSHSLPCGGTPPSVILWPQVCPLMAQLNDDLGRGTGVCETQPNSSSSSGSAFCRQHMLYFALSHMERSSAVKTRPCVEGLWFSMAAYNWELKSSPLQGFVSGKAFVAVHQSPILHSGLCNDDVFNLNLPSSLISLNRFGTQSPRNIEGSPFLYNTCILKESDGMEQDLCPLWVGFSCCELLLTRILF